MDARGYPETLKLKCPTCGVAKTLPFMTVGTEIRRHTCSKRHGGVQWVLKVTAQKFKKVDGVVHTIEWMPTASRTAVF